MICHLSYVQCDRCGNPGPLGDTAKEARTLADGDGWARKWNARLRRWSDLCPPCDRGVMFRAESGMFVPTQRPTALKGWSDG